MSTPIYDPKNDNPVLAFAISEHAYNNAPIYWRFPMTVDEVEQFSNKPTDTTTGMWGPTHLVCVSGDLTLPNVEIWPYGGIFEWLAQATEISMGSIHQVYSCHPQALLSRLAFWRSLHDQQPVPNSLLRPVNLVQVLNNPASVLMLPERKNFTMYNVLRWILPPAEFLALAQKTELADYAAHLYRLLFQRIRIQDILT